MIFHANSRILRHSWWINKDSVAIASAMVSKNAPNFPPFLLVSYVQMREKKHQRLDYVMIGLVFSLSSNSLMEMLHYFNVHVYILRYETAFGSEQSMCTRIFMSASRVRGTDLNRVSKSLVFCICKICGIQCQGKHNVFGLIMIIFNGTNQFSSWQIWW